MSHETMLYKLFICCICILSISGDSCTYGDLSLSHFTHTPITCLYTGNQSEINPDETNRYTINYRACHNDFACQNIDNKYYHLIRRNENNQNCQQNFGYLYNPDIQPIKSTYNGKESYYFYYTKVGVSVCPAQTWTRIEFVCDNELYNEQKLKCFDFFDETGACAFVVIIPTSSACIDSAGKMSGGSIFLILLFVTISVYILIGYIWNGYKNKNWKRIDNIPHYEFWKFLPAYVKVGCGISYQWVTSKVNGDKQYAMQETSDP
eukprot:92468_1